MYPTERRKAADGRLVEGGAGLWWQCCPRRRQKARDLDQRAGGGEGVRGDGTEKRKGRREGGEKEPIRSYRLLKGEQPINLSHTVQIYVVRTYYC